MTDEPPIINLDVTAGDAAAARGHSSRACSRPTVGTTTSSSPPTSTSSAGSCSRWLDEAALLAFQVHVDHPDTPAVKIVDMLAANEPRKGLRLVDPDPSP